MTNPIVLTAINGGINRLRVKGGADKNSLYDLLNGYVTQSGTVKVRPGTLRNANIAQYSGAGMTKGLVAYQNQFHVFASSVVDVPPGYALHVLTHPAAQQQITSGSPGVDVTTAILAAPGSSGGYPFNGGFWEKDGAGYGSGVSLGGVTITACGAASVTNIGGQTLGSVGVSIQTSFTGGGLNPSLPAVIVCLPAGLARDFFTSLTITPAGGGAHVLNTADAVFNPTAFNSLAGYTIWAWQVATAANYFNVGETSTVKFSGAGGGSTTVNVNIPLKKIHFSAPYLGGLYVVAEFDTTSAINAQFGSVFHYWIQSSTGSDNSNFWQPNHDYLIGDVVIPNTPNGLTYIAARRFPANPVWTPNTAETVGNVAEPTVPTGFQFTVTNVEGAAPSTGATEPTWPASDGATVTENSALANDESFVIVTPAPTAPVPPVPPRYSGGIAGGSFS